MGGSRAEAPEKKGVRAKTKVLYIGGFGRSGSTLLSRILGGVPGVCAVGELEYVWEECFSGRQPCGCGAPFRECPFWGAVVEDVWGGFDEVPLSDILRAKHSVDRMRHIPRLALPHKSNAFAEDLARYSEILDRFYAAMVKVSGSRVVVDSSKIPSYGYALASMPWADLHVVHLVRDGRAAAYSWLRKRVKYASHGEEVYMHRHGPINSSLGWLRTNLLMEPLKALVGPRYVRVRYEDLIEDPKNTLSEILALIGEDPAKLPLADDRNVNLGVDHVVEGNPMRFRRGMVRLQADEEWRQKMRPADRRTVTAITWPLLLRHGYPVRASRPGTRPEDLEAG